MPNSPTPRPGDQVELTIRGVYREYDAGDPLPHLIETRPGVAQWIPDGELRVVDPPEPTVVGTVVTGWPRPDDRPQSMHLFVLTGTDGDGDGRRCWQAPGETHEYAWPAVLADTTYGRRVIAPPTGDGAA